MALYRCLARGENFLMKEDGVPKRIGFYANRWVEATCPEDAEQQVIALLRDEPLLQRPDWHDGAGPNAKVYVEEIEVVEPDQRGPNKGFAIFLEDDEGS